jgi:hypothetical protein
MPWVTRRDTREPRADRIARILGGRANGRSGGRFGKARFVDGGGDQS